MRNLLLAYAKYFNTPKGLWHVHSNYTDGQYSIEKIFDLAASHGIEFICFIEHIRREPSYDPHAFMREVAIHSTERHVHAIVGFEAKLLHDGSINAPDNLDSFIFLAEHGTVSCDKDEYFATLLKGLSNPRLSGWVHPGLFAQRMKWNFSNHEIDLLISALKQNHLIYETNLRYNVPVPFLSTALQWANIPHFIGVDFHQEEDLTEFMRLYNKKDTISS